MRKILLYMLAVSVVSTVTGCLKDKDYDDKKYGLQITEVKGVAFPQASSSPIVIGINSQATPQTVDGPFVTLEEDKTPSSTVTVTLQINQGLVTAAGMIPLDPTAFSINSLTVTFAAGQKLSDAIKITVANSSILDPNQSYGIGLTISAVDQGYKIAANQKDIVIGFNIKNKYDGVYNLRGVHNRSPYTYPFEMEVEMWTTGPSSVAMYLPPPFGDFGQPIGTSGGISWYGNAVSPNFIFDPSGSGPGGSDLCTGVTLQVGAAVTLDLVTAGGIVNRYENTTKTMYLTYQYNGNDLRRFYDTLTYIGPR